MIMLTTYAQQPVQPCSPDLSGLDREPLLVRSQASKRQVDRAPRIVANVGCGTLSSLRLVNDLWADPG
jgi:hypothetical protein